ncbi:hypothetical protein C0J52_18776 [Blattella germanica]|nr:hypothetical protein C0J52_24109 [Blattella germanica]PSN45126.1 hypothetical protein C0J52_18776 [Blattella germanica]
MRHLNETSVARAVSLIEDDRSFRHVSRLLMSALPSSINCGGEIGRHMDTRGGQGKAIRRRLQRWRIDFLSYQLCVNEHLQPEIYKIIYEQQLGQ